jgi:transposase
MTEIGDVRRDNAYKQSKIDQWTHEMAMMWRRQCGAGSVQSKGEQRHLPEETVEADLEAMALELKALQRVEAQAAPKEAPKRAPLPPRLPRTAVRHEPASTLCACGCSLTRIGEDIGEKLDYTPGVFTVERHVRGKWVCRECETLVQAPVPSHVIDKGVRDASRLRGVTLVDDGREHHATFEFRGAPQSPE